MFKQCCGKCGECWWIGNPRTCTCPDETPKRTWVGLTDEEMMQIYIDLKSVAGFYSVEKYARDIEAKLKEKNNG